MSSERPHLQHAPTPRSAKTRWHEAEEFIEAEEGARQPAQGLARRCSSPLLAVGMSAVPPLRGLRDRADADAAAGARGLRAVRCASCVFPVAKRFRHRVMWWDWLAACAVDRRRRLPDRRAATTSPTATRCPNPADIAFGIALIVLVLEAMRRTTGWIMPVVDGLLPRLRAARPVAAGAVDAQGLRGRPPGRLHVHDARGHLRRGGRRVVVADHPVHDLRRLPAALRRRQVLHRLLASRAMGGKPTGAGRTVVLASFLLGGPSGSGVATTVTHRLGGLSDAGQGRLRARTPPAGCSPPAGWARSSRRRCWAPPPS
ncbi:MAG: hypothetical protein MZW92_35295 [Comamonadaceae bacterium]|nr:hypothetical protein [Comamonadaceae bacterium]